MDLLSGNAFTPKSTRQPRNDRETVGRANQGENLSETLTAQAGSEADAELWATTVLNGAVENLIDAAIYLLSTHGPKCVEATKAIHTLDEAKFWVGAAIAYGVEKNANTIQAENDGNTE